MTLIAALPARIDFRAFFRLLVWAAALAGGTAVLAPPMPAYALERQPYGDVTVPAGATKDQVYTAMGNVTVDGMVAGDVYAGSGNVFVNGPVDGDIKAGRGNVSIQAPVDGEVKAGFGNVYINSRVDGDVNVGHGNLHLGSKAYIDGDLRCASGRIEPDRGSVVTGNTLSGMTADFGEDPGPSSWVVRSVGWILGALALVGVTVLAAVLMPRPLDAATRQLEAAPWLSLGLGVVSIPVIVVLMIVLAVSIVGSPLILLLLPAYGGLLLFGAVVAAFFAGRRFLFATGRYHSGNALAAIAGALLVAAVYLIPYVGQVIVSLLALLGLGATLLALFTHRRSRSPAPSYETYVEERSEV